MRNSSFCAVLVARAVCTAACCLTATSAVSQSYPSKNVTMVVPYTAGGSSDIMARAVGKRLADAWGKSVIIDNRAGASGMIGAELVSRAAPDGYVLLVTTSSYPATAATRKKLAFNAATAIVPAAMIAKAPIMLTINHSTKIAQDVTRRAFSL